jgi:putative colanic acid biosynthesis UDP-glucose lipid carrier transferase
MREFKKNYIYLIFDLIALAISFIMAIFISKNRLIDMPEINGGIEPVEIVLLMVFLFIWSMFSNLTDLYDDFKIIDNFSKFNLLIKSIFVQIVVLVFFLFFLKSILLSRFFIFIYTLLFFVLLNINRLILKFYKILIGNKSEFTRKIIIVGKNELAKEFCEIIKKSPTSGYKIIDTIELSRKSLNGASYISKLKNYLEGKDIDEIVFAIEQREYDLYDEMITLAENYPVRVKIIPEYSKLMSKKFTMSTFGNIPIISIKDDLLDNLFWRFLKRSFDLFLSIFSFVFIFIWLYPIIAMLIKLTSKGPVFFKQERWGKKNKKIIVYKFRTMKDGKNDIDDNGNYKQAKKNDSRITRIGAFLRKSNLDELPQLINVIIGNMSIVGPRPHPTPLNIESKSTVKKYLKRHLVKPGITGWAQVNGLRGETSKEGLMQKRVDYDIWYIENWSFWLDFKIIILTFWNMIRGDKNAY